MFGEKSNNWHTPPIWNIDTISSNGSSMDKIYKILMVIMGLGLWKAYQLALGPPLPPLEKNPWWGPGKRGEENIAIRPFKINIPKAEIEDLKMRLALPLRVAPALEDANSTYGINPSALKVVYDYWLNDYDWKKREAKMNAYSHFITQIEGLDIHFLRVKPTLPSSGADNVIQRPLLLMHGWPGSVLEFLDLIPLLTSPDERGIVFEVICPSLPGYGFSQASAKPGLGVMETAQIFLKLMQRLGFSKFYIHGGDWGSFIAGVMATYFPGNVLGMHANMVTISTPGTTLKYFVGSFMPSGLVIHHTDEKNLYPMSSHFNFFLQETGYLHIQATKPDTVGAALSNTPVGLLAYLLEKFSSWTNKANPSKPDGGLLEKDFPIPLERILDQVSLYWFTQTITSSMRFYAESVGKLMRSQLDQIMTHVPAGFSVFAHEIFNHPEYFASQKYALIVSYKKHDFGGHFAAMECPKILAEDIFEFIAEVERRRNLMKFLGKEDL